MNTLWSKSWETYLWSSLQKAYSMFTAAIQRSAALYYNNSLQHIPQSSSLKIFLLTSISHRALLLVAEVADCRPVVRRKTYCFFLWSSHVRNFSCSAWNNRTTSPWTEGERLLLSKIFSLIFKPLWPVWWSRSDYKLMLCSQTLFKYDAFYFKFYLRYQSLKLHWIRQA